MVRNKRGQITSNRTISTKLIKALQEAANNAAIRIKPLVRDELEQTLRSEIYASYTPATERGKAIQEYNETHKHQKPQSYHHTGLLASSVYATIQGDVIQAVIKDKQYPDGASTTEVYDYLKFGTTDTPKKSDTYAYANGTEFSKYIPQEPHNFEARTREYMNEFLDNLLVELQTEKGKEKYIGKYLNKRI